jgi:hypothetical protein
MSLTVAWKLESYIRSAHSGIDLRIFFGFEEVAYHISMIRRLRNRIRKINRLPEPTPPILRLGLRDMLEVNERLYRLSILQVPKEWRKFIKVEPGWYLPPNLAGDSSTH